MSFRNIPDDLVLPPGGNLIPGSGTLYIGSKRIPADLLADGALAALVWYSNSDGLAAGIDYWYIAHLRIGAQADLFQAGYKQTGLGRKAIWGGWLDASGNQFTTFEAQQAVTLKSSLTDVFLTSTSHDVLATAARAVFIEGDFTGPGAVQLIAPNGTVSFGKASGIPGTGLRIGGWASGGTTAYVKAINTIQDSWNSWSTTATLLGVLWTIAVDWRITPDYVMDIRILMNNGPGCAAGNVTFPMPPGISPFADAAPTTSIGVRCGYGTLLTFPPLTTLASRLSISSPTVTVLDTWNVPAGVTQLEGSIVMTGVKP